MTEPVPIYYPTTNEYVTTHTGDCLNIVWNDDDPAIEQRLEALEQGLHLVVGQAAQLRQAFEDLLQRLKDLEDRNESIKATV